MKYLILISCVLLLGFYTQKESPSDFDADLSDIVCKFKEGIMDKDICQKQKREVEYLADDIGKAMDNEVDYSPDEIKLLKGLKKEAEAVEDYIGAVGNCGNNLPSIDDFNLANRRIRGNIGSIAKDKYCVDVISVSIGDYVACLIENRSLKNYNVTYKWKSQNGMLNGRGEMGFSKMSIRHLYDNRESPKQKTIVILELTCKEF